MSKPRKRQWHHKQERTRARRAACREEIILLEDVVHEPQHQEPEHNCLRDCPDRGACCRHIILWENGEPWPKAKDYDTAKAMLDAHPQCYSFEIRGTVDGLYKEGRSEPIWYITCRMVDQDGTCGIYEQRPDLCRSFTPKRDALCCLAPDPGNVRDHIIKKLQPFPEEA